MRARSIPKKLSANSKQDAADARLLLDNVSGYAICILDKHGRIRTWNTSASKLTGYTKSEAIGKSYSIFFRKSDAKRGVPQRILKYAAERGQYRTESIRQRKDGTRYWANVTINAIWDTKKRLIGFAKVTHDATRERELLQQKDEFIGIAAHELKTPITTLSLYAQLLRERLSLTSDESNLVMMNDIESQAARLVNLIDDLLIANALEFGAFALHKEDFNLDDLVHEAIKSFQSMTSLHTISSVGLLKKSVHGDRERIRQVFINIIENAVKYSPRGAIVVRLAKKNGRAVLSVRDFGPGIPKADRKKIFKSRYRLKQRKNVKTTGLGLGLYICAEIIKTHGGRIWVESTLGKGSTFYFTLPFAKSNLKPHVS
ncbi:MAG: Sensory box histidine kinase [Parcubacteria group bacterium GW2011_GWA2_51_10]|nr:MAG: Sensory box histidine kinase [Parcubacteria group bacterium GW2011_GWA2_51_10]